MSPYPGTGKELCQTHQQQGKLFCLLCGPGVCRMSVRIQTALVADTYTFIIPPRCVGPDLMNRTADVYFTVTCDIEMITDACKTSCLMTTAKSFYGKILSQRVAEQ